MLLNGDQTVSLILYSQTGWISTPFLGTLQTPATWIRNFVRSHPAYKFDSVVSQEINYDLMVAVDNMCVPSFLSLSVLASDSRHLVNVALDENQTCFLKITMAVPMTKALSCCNTMCNIRFVSHRSQRISYSSIYIARKPHVHAVRFSFADVLGVEFMTVSSLGLRA